VKIEITGDREKHKCRNCGEMHTDCNEVYVDGKMIISLPAYWACYMDHPISKKELLIIALRQLVHHVEINGI